MLIPRTKYYVSHFFMDFLFGLETLVATLLAPQNLTIQFKTMICVILYFSYLIKYDFIMIIFSTYLIKSYFKIFFTANESYINVICQSNGIVSFIQSKVRNTLNSMLDHNNKLDKSAIFSPTQQITSKKKKCVSRVRG